MNEDKKSNQCHIDLKCTSKKYCVYYSESICKDSYFGAMCSSSVAMVNAMTLEIKRLTGEL